MMRTANPALNSKTFKQFGYVDKSRVMTIQGTVHKTAILLLLVLASASWVWTNFFKAGPTGAQAVSTWVTLGAVGGLIMAIVTIFKRQKAHIFAPIYALLEGLFLGGISAMLEARFPGIVIQAVSLTFGTLFCLLMAYRSGLIKPTENFKLGIAAATGGIFMVYMATFILGFFGMHMPFIHQGGIIGIGFSLFVVVIAALNLVLDFDFIEQGAEQGAPKYMEWYAAFGLIVTLIWLYIEILRLLAKIRSRN
jgi:uncharacterized YccA/Bax inhibitor family protein